mmetsp:Transcript_37859/g.63658  ORF Transcript_37859/g.63658 Transcript_37859/m.63658 type:complete len:211 (+) Transcript_37859:548-1180(+)
MASPMAGVPASNLDGGPAYVDTSRSTSWIISPPPIHGGMVSSTSSLPHRNPIPVGAHILWPEATMKSAPSACTSTFMCGTLWQQSSSTFAPTAFAIDTTSSVGMRQPSVLETCARLTSLVRGVTRERRWAMSSISFSSSCTNFSTHLLRCARSCHGTRLLWCSMTDSTISSPSLRFSCPHVLATRLMASVALRQYTISRQLEALMNFATD